MTSAMIVAGGDRPPKAVFEQFGAVDLIIAADSGADHLAAVGWPVDLVVGDLDSIDQSTLARLGRDGVDVHQYPEDKDQTDLELALEAALDRSVTSVSVVGIAGGRFDHELANIALLTQPRFASLALTAIAGSALISVVHSQRTLAGRVGELVSLMACNGDAKGVRTTGLDYPLNDEPLTAGSSRGVSNRFRQRLAEISLESGVVLAIQPQALD